MSFYVFANYLCSIDCMRDAVDLLLKASGYLEFCIRDGLVRLPPDIKYADGICQYL